MATRTRGTAKASSNPMPGRSRKELEMSLLTSGKGSKFSQQDLRLILDSVVKLESAGMIYINTEWKGTPRPDQLAVNLVSPSASDITSLLGSISKNRNISQMLILRKGIPPHPSILHTELGFKPGFSK